MLGIVAMPLEPDYNKPVQKIYCETMRLLLTLENPFTALPFAGIGYPRFQDLAENDIPPSWVADWRCIDRPSSEMGAVDLSQSEESKPWIGFLYNGYTIELKGAYLDSIKELASVHEIIFKPGVDFSGHDLTQKLRKWYQQAKAMAFKYSRNSYTKKPDGDIETVEEAF
jgi:hypothetical protein